MEEIWKDIPNYEGYYQASSLGRIRGLARQIKTSTGIRTIKAKILALNYRSKHRYLSCALSKNGRLKSYSVHRLVTLSFLGESTLHVDHINGFKVDNRLCNLEYVTLQENNRRFQMSYKTSSVYIGVWHRKERNVWVANITRDRKTVHIGTFKTEYEAYLARECALKELQE